MKDFATILHTNSSLTGVVELLALSWFVFCWMRMDADVKKDGGSAPKKVRVLLKLKQKPGIPVSNATNSVAFVEPVITNAMNIEQCT